MTVRLKWKRTWPGEPRRRGDFTARRPDNPQALVRVHLIQSPDARGDLWYWTASAGQGAIAKGYAWTKDEAVKLAEEASLGPPAAARS